MLPGILGNPYLTRRLMSKITNEAPGNVAPIIPIETAVTGGRSYWAWKRSGFLELQERLTEEICAAVVWLGGVSTMSKLIDKAIGYAQSKGHLKGVYANSDWSSNFMKQFLSGQHKVGLGLSPLESFNHHHAGMKKTLLVKGLKWGVSIAVPIVLMAYIVPVLNQKKSEWILKTFYSGKSCPQPHSVKPDAPSATDAISAKLDNLPSKQAVGYSHSPASPIWQPVLQPRYAAPKFPTAPWQYVTPTLTGMAANTVATRSFQPSPFPGVRGFPVMAPTGTGAPMPWAAGTARFGHNLTNHPAAISGGKPKFGLMGRALPLLSMMGSAVDNSLYGRVLVVDCSLTGGRMAVAWARSKFESLEYFLRDATSLIFYLFTVPWMMTGAANLLKSETGRRATQRLFGKNFGTVIHLDPLMTNHFNIALQRRLKAVCGKGPVTAEKLRQVLYGPNLSKAEGRALNRAATLLETELRQIDRTAFISGLQTELNAFSRNPAELQKTRQLGQKLLNYLERKGWAGGSKINADQVQTLLEAVWNGDKKLTLLNGLSNAERFHLSTAIKNTFHYGAGLNGEALSQLVSKAAGSDLSVTLQTELLGPEGPLMRQARLGADKVVAGSLRRSLGAAQLGNQFSQKASLEIEPIVRCAEQAAIDGTPLSSFVHTRLNQVVNEYRQYRAAAGKKPLNAASRQLETQMGRLSKLLAHPTDASISREFLSELTGLLKQNGRSGNWMRFLQGSGLGHLAQDIEFVLPLFQANTSHNTHTLLAEQVTAAMQNLVKASNGTHQQALISQYQAMTEKLLAGEGRAVLPVSRAMPEFKQIGESIQAMLRGGLAREEGLYSRALQCVGQRPATVEAFFDSSLLGKTQSLGKEYWELVEKRLAGLSKSELGSVERFTQTVLNPISKHNTWTRYGVWGMAFAVSAFSISYLIPKAQYWITKRLTGKDTHPGLAAVSNRLHAETSNKQHSLAS